MRLALVLGVVAATTVACSRTDPALYAPLHELADDLGVTDVGPVLAERTWGTGGFSSTDPTLGYLIGGCDIYPTLVDLVDDAGFEAYAPTRYVEGRPVSGWSTTGRATAPLVSVAEQEPDSAATFHDELVEFEGCATQVNILGSRPTP